MLPSGGSLFCILSWVCSKIKFNNNFFTDCICLVMLYAIRGVASCVELLFMTRFYYSSSVVGCYPIILSFCCYGYHFPEPLYLVLYVGPFKFAHRDAGAKYCYRHSLVHVLVFFLPLLYLPAVYGLTILALAILKRFCLEVFCFMQSIFDVDTAYMSSCWHYLRLIVFSATVVF